MDRPPDPVIAGKRNRWICLRESGPDSLVQIVRSEARMGEATMPDTNRHHGR